MLVRTFCERCGINGPISVENAECLATGSGRNHRFLQAPQGSAFAGSGTTLVARAATATGSASYLSGSGTLTAGAATASGARNEGMPNSSTRSSLSIEFWLFYALINGGVSGGPEHNYLRAQNIANHLRSTGVGSVEGAARAMDTAFLNAVGANAGERIALTTAADGEKSKQRNPDERPRHALHAPAAMLGGEGEAFEKGASLGSKGGRGRGRDAVVAAKPRPRNTVKNSSRLSAVAPYVVATDSRVPIVRDQLMTEAAAEAAVSDQISSTGSKKNGMEYENVFHFSTQSNPGMEEIMEGFGGPTPVYETILKLLEKFTIEVVTSLLGRRATEAYVKDLALPLFDELVLAKFGRVDQCGLICYQNEREYPDSASTTNGVTGIVLMSQGADAGFLAWENKNMDYDLTPSRAPFRTAVTQLAYEILGERSAIFKCFKLVPEELIGVLTNGTRWAIVSSHSEAAAEAPGSSPADFDVDGDDDYLSWSHTAVTVTVRDDLISAALKDGKGFDAEMILHRALEVLARQIDYALERTARVVAESAVSPNARRAAQSQAAAATGKDDDTDGSGGGRAAGGGGVGNGTDDVDIPGGGGVTSAAAPPSTNTTTAAASGNNMPRTTRSAGGTSTSRSRTPSATTRTNHNTSKRLIRLPLTMNALRINSDYLDLERGANASGQGVVCEYPAALKPCSQ